MQVLRGTLACLVASAAGYANYLPSSWTRSGKRPSDWTPDRGDLRTLRGTRLVGNNPFMRVLERRCSDTGKHSHRAVIGESDLGESRASEAAAYPSKWLLLTHLP